MFVKETLITGLSPDPIKHTSQQWRS